MDYVLLILLAAVFLGQGLILALFLQRNLSSPHGRSRKGQVSSVLNVMDSYNKLTAIKWYADMMLNEETGELNIAQLQFLNKIADESEAVLLTLRSASEDMHASISSEQLMQEVKKEGNRG
jgi:hypothetical protein